MAEKSDSHLVDDTIKLHDLEFAIIGHERLRIKSLLHCRPIPISINLRLAVGPSQKSCERTT